MFQDDKPIAFASKSLTTAETNYAQIEKELYATVFGCERFYQYVYGRAVTLFTDHKPLEAIMGKSLADSTQTAEDDLTSATIRDTSLLQAWKEDPCR